MIQLCLRGIDAEMSQRAEYGYYAVEALMMRLFCYGPEDDARSPGHGVLRFKCTRLSDGLSFELAWDTETGLCRSTLLGDGWVTVHEMSKWMLRHDFGGVLFDVLKPMLEAEEDDSTFELQAECQARDAIAAADMVGA